MLSEVWRAGGGYWETEALGYAIATNAAVAIAEASVAAISVKPHTCVAGGYVSAETEGI